MQAITHNGTTLTLLQEPYLDTVQRRIGDTVEEIDGTVFRAAAEDAEGTHYDVYWTRLKETTDGPEVRDWNKFVVL